MLASTTRCYTYRGDKLTDAALRGQLCAAVLRADGKCIRGRNGSFLVQFADGTRHVVLGRQLRKVACGGPHRSALAGETQPAHCKGTRKQG